MHCTWKYPAIVENNQCSSVCPSPTCICTSPLVELLSKIIWGILSILSQRALLWCSVLIRTIFFWNIVDNCGILGEVKRQTVNFLICHLPCKLWFGIPYSTKRLRRNCPILHNVKKVSQVRLCPLKSLLRSHTTRIPLQMYIRNF